MPLFDERSTSLLENLHVPSTYWKNKTIEYKYWFRSLLQKIDSSLKFRNLPETWSQDFFMFCLWALGYVAVFKTDQDFADPKYGTAFQPCALEGYDIYYQPTHAQVSNPKFTKRFEIGKDCEILKLTPDFAGVFDVLDYYASKLAELSKGIDQGLINTKFPLILTAQNEAQAATLKKVYDKVQKGESLVVWDDTENSDEMIPRKNPFETWSQDFKATYIVGTMLDDMQKILNSFYMEIGLPTSVDKKSHVLNEEADFQSAQSQARIACWITTLNESLEKINKMFGMEVTVEYERANDDDWDGTNPERHADVNERDMEPRD